MKLTDEEQALRAGEYGPAAQWAIEHQIKVGEYLGAADMVPVMQAHIMADTESLGVAGVEWLERMAGLPAEQRQVRIPTITDPRGTDFAAAHRLKQQPWMLELERRAIAAFEALGVLMTNTCINYQTIMPPVLGEHVAYGDTGVVIYSQQRVRRALELRGRTFRAERRAHRPHAALRLSSRRAAGGHARRQRRLDAARAQRLGRARRDRRAAWPATIGRSRPSSASIACRAPTR